MEKYGKAMEDVLKFKTDFFLQNQELLKESNRINEIYKEQPCRQVCKVCGNQLSSDIYFESHKIEYIKCKKCGHINGKYEDTMEYNKALYVDSDYGYNYRTGEYWDRVKKVYLPKMQFLLDSIKDDIEECSILDIGAGSGYFVAAGKINNIQIQGVEISPQQVEFGNHMMGEERLYLIGEDELLNTISNSKANILSAVGVFEHLGNLREVLRVISNNKNIKYVFCSVPMFSVSVLLEIMNQRCYNRQLGGGHTHLFTNSSIDFICDEFGWENVSTWRFGSDIMDFYRMLNVEVDQYKELKHDIQQIDFKKLDELQLLLDKMEISSEKHFVFKTC